MSEHDESDGPDLAPAHPTFAAHFIRPIYHPDHPDFGDDVPPFGSDEGWDEVYSWSERLGELRSDPTLRFMIKSGDMDADGFVRELAESDQPDVDDILIGMGLALLRFTGQIDPEGKAWLEQALVRRSAGWGGGRNEYASVLEDLTSFSPGSISGQE